MSEQVLQSGTLGEPTLLALLVSACRAPFPVVLHLARAPEHVRSFHFRDCRLTGFDTSASGEGIAAMLVKRKRLSPEAAKDVERSAQAENVTAAAIIQRLRLIPAATLDREISLWATLLLIQSFAWESGTFRLVSVSGSDVLPAAIDVDVPGAMKSGVFKRIKEARADAALAPYESHLPQLAADAIIPLEAFGFSEDQLGLARSLDGSRTLAALRADAADAEEFARILYLLHQSESVVFQAPQEETTDLGSLLDEFGESEDSMDGVGKEDLATIPAGAPPAGGIDFSQIRFGASAGRGRSSTSHRSTAHLREEVAANTACARVQVVTGASPSVQDDLSPVASRDTSAGLGDDLFAGLGKSPREAGRPRGRGGNTSPPTPKAPKGPAIDQPPIGVSFTIEQHEWNRLSTKEKARISEMAERLKEMAEQNYFQWLDLPNEAPLMSVKKAFFKLAQRFHPDKMLDEGEVYARLAEVLFTKVSEAYETLGDEELSAAYVRKHIYGEKDENDLAMEKVQQILNAEAEFKRGQRLLNAGKLVGALGAFKLAMEGYPEEGEYYAYYGYLLFRLKQKSDPGEAAGGIELIEKAIQMSPLATAPPHLLGKCYLLMGDGAAAKKAVRESLKMNADNPDALRDYKRADAMSKGEDPDGRTDSKQGGIKGLFGRFSKKK